MNFMCTLLGIENEYYIWPRIASDKVNYTCELIVHPV